MFGKRIKIFIIISTLLLLIFALRLAQLQLVSHPFYLKRIAELKLQQGVSRQLNTIRGKILDRKGRILATEEPQFQLHINYKLSCVLDERVRRAILIRAYNKSTPAAVKMAVSKERKELDDKLEKLRKIIDKCTYFEREREDIEQEINNINNICFLKSDLSWSTICSRFISIYLPSYIECWNRIKISTSYTGYLIRCSRTTSCHSNP